MKEYKKVMFMPVSEGEWGKGKIWERRELLENLERKKWNDSES